MKKFLLIVMLLFIVTGCNLFDDSSKLDNGTNNNQEQSYKNDKIIEKEFELNGEKHEVKFEYSYKNEFLQNDSEPCSNCNVYNYNLTITLDNKEIGLNNIPIGIIQDISNSSVNYVSLENIKTIKDESTNDEYLVIYYNTLDEPTSNNVYLIDKTGNILYNYKQQENFSLHIDNSDALPLVEIRDNIKVVKVNNCEDFYLEEVSVKNNKINTKRIEFSEDIKLSGEC